MEQESIIESSATPFYRGRFFVLFISLLLLFVLYPFMDGESLTEMIIIDALFLGIPFASVYALLKDRRRFRNAAIVFAAASLGLRSLAYVTRMSAIEYATLFVDFGFYTLLAIIVARHVFSRGHVTFDRLFGAGCVYLLMGLLWSILFVLLLKYEPQAFIFNTVPEKTFTGMAPDHVAGNMIYLSYVTLTTVGYGDIVPNTRVAGMLASLEALAGQLFMATLVARLVGLHIAQSAEKHRAQERR